MKEETKKTVDYRFKNGVLLNGTAEQLLQYAALIGESIDPSKLGGVIPKGYYYSSSNGLVKIEDMETPHIVFALNKRTVEYYEQIRPKVRDFDLSNYLEQYLSLTDDPQIEELFRELTKRKK